jgi:hypothetical protein
VHTPWSLGDTGVIQIAGNPVRKVTAHAQSPHDTVEVLMPVGMIRGSS